MLIEGDIDLDLLNKLAYELLDNLDKNMNKRMARTVSGIFKHNKINTNEIDNWLNSFINIEKEGIQLIVAKSNSRNFLTALKVYMKHEDFIYKRC